MANIFSIINHKGGTGKTTTAANLAGALSKMKYKVLAIDFDSQCNLSLNFGLKNPEIHVGKVLQREKTIEDAIVERNKISVIPSTDSLINYEIMLNSEPGREFIVKELLEPIKEKFDFILIDCAPSLGLLSINSLVAADYYFVPMQAENFAFIGLDRILETASKVKARLNPKLELGGIIMIMFDTRRKFSKAVVYNISENKKIRHKLFDSYVRKDISLMESSAFNQTVFEYAPNSRGAMDYTNVAKEIIKRYGKA